MRFIFGCLIFAVLLLPVEAQLPRLEQMVPGLSIRTSFASDHGDLLDAIIFRGVEYKPSEASSKILPMLNWGTREDRLELGQAWVEEIALFGSEVVRPGNERFPDLDGPQAIILPSGTVRYTAWAVSMRGRSPGSQVHQWQVDIDPEGRVTTTSLKSNQPGQLRL